MLLAFPLPYSLLLILSRFLTFSFALSPTSVSLPFVATGSVLLRFAPAPVIYHLLRLTFSYSTNGSPPRFDLHCSVHNDYTSSTLASSSSDVPRSDYASGDPPIAICGPSIVNTYNVSTTVILNYTVPTATSSIPFTGDDVYPARAIRIWVTPSYRTTSGNGIDEQIETIFPLKSHPPIVTSSSELLLPPRVSLLSHVLDESGSVIGPLAGYNVVLALSDVFGQPAFVYSFHDTPDTFHSLTSTYTPANQGSFQADTYTVEIPSSSRGVPLNIYAIRPRSAEKHFLFIAKYVSSHFILLRDIGYCTGIHCL